MKERTEGEDKKVLLHQLFPGKSQKGPFQGLKAKPEGVRRQPKGHF